MSHKNGTRFKWFKSCLGSVYFITKRSRYNNDNHNSEIGKHSFEHIYFKNEFVFFFLFFFFFFFGGGGGGGGYRYKNRMAHAILLHACSNKITIAYIFLGFGGLKC